MDIEKYFENYERFVDAVTSNESRDTESFIARIKELEEAGANPARLLTAGIGLASEGGEFDEIVKKMVFQGKEFNEDVAFHLKRELGDVCWYWIQACIALNLNPVDVINENIKKLESRYPGGTFDVYHSENRKENDL